jgi:hypothetical protein
MKNYRRGKKIRSMHKEEDAIIYFSSKNRPNCTLPAGYAAIYSASCVLFRMYNNTNWGSKAMECGPGPD